MWLLLAVGLIAAGRRMVNQFRWARPDDQFLRNVDRFYLTNCPEGNVFIDFDGLTAERDGEFIFVQFMRSSYALHPRRVYVTNSNVQLRGSDYLLKYNQVPADEWLREHGVDVVLTFSGQGGIPKVITRRVGKGAPE
jgi:hypothetical protein